MENYLYSSIKNLKGVGDRRACALFAMGIHNISDLLEHFPRRYEDRTSVKKILECCHEETVCIKAKVISDMRVSKVRNNLTIYSISVSDGTGVCELTWFNIKFIERKFRIGDEYLFYGKFTAFPKKRISSPVFEKENEKKQLGRIFPVYPLASGITQNMLSGYIIEALKNENLIITETLPDWVIKEYSLCSRRYAVFNIHFPTSSMALEKAKKRLAFEELFMFQSALFRLKKTSEKKKIVPFKSVDIDDFTSILPFSFTNAQKRVADEIYTDLRKSTPMNRLVCGDVGSGKTIIAAAAIFATIKNGAKAAMMAPTEILAGQHFKNLKSLFSKLDIDVELLLGSTSQAEKNRIYARLLEKKPLLVVGTHALISENVNFNKLGLVITDEQHRFGVNQRKTLSEKADSPHILVMTATPIPRTMALILYGDLDISIIDELPPGRQKIDTFALYPSMHERVYNFIRKEANLGRQAYIVCPLVEDSEKLNLKSVTEYAKTLKKDVFSDLSLEFLHGKMKQAEKEVIMRDFADGKTQILVATSVIEVGVDIPNATLMIVENAERFGLSQLHQLRGRVGRGQHKSYCILFCESKTDIAKKRMQTMQNESDGFKIAETDLSLRGPGDFFGTKQHGLPIFKIADLYCDMPLLEVTTIAAKKLLEDDPFLQKAENLCVLDKINSFFDKNVTFS